MSVIFKKSPEIRCEYPLDIDVYLGVAFSLLVSIFATAIGWLLFEIVWVYDDLH